MKKIIQFIVNLLFSATILTIFTTIICREKGVADGSTESFYFTYAGFPNG
jgi:hypothetical protein